MREIKFRAYHTEGGTDGMFSWNEIINTYKWTIDELFNDTTIIPMEYTGLKDKNGKEIYEGDIVKFTRQQGYSYLNKGSIAKIDWFNFQYTGFGINKNIPLTEKRSKELEVIGNILENPELLK